MTENLYVGSRNFLGCQPDKHDGDDRDIRSGRHERRAARIREQGGKCTERNANLIIAGKQKPNVYAMHALNGALLADRMP